MDFGSRHASGEKRAAHQLVLPLLLLSLRVFGESAPATPLPAVIYAHDPAATAPLWVDAEAAFDRKGQLRRELFPHSWEGMLRDFTVDAGHHEASTRLENLTDDSRCAGIVGDIEGDSGERHDPQTLKELADGAIAIYFGRVAGIKPGFFGEDPASMIEADVEVIRSFDQSPASATATRIHLVYRYARFAVGGLVACVGLRPIKVGDRFVAFVSHEPRDEQKALIVPDDLCVESADGRVTSNHRWMVLIKAVSEKDPGLDVVVAAARRSELERTRER